MNGKNNPLQPSNKAPYYTQAQRIGRSAFQIGINTMKTSINFSEFCNAFRDMDRNENFSYEGKKALFYFLEEMEEQTGEEYELDVIALCCEFAESSTDELIADYGIDVSEAEDDEEKAEIVEEYLQDCTAVVGKLDNGSFVYAQF